MNFIAKFHNGEIVVFTVLLQQAAPWKRQVCDSAGNQTQDSACKTVVLTATEPQKKKEV